MRRMIIAITGASGSIYGVRLLELLRTRPDVELHLVMSKSAARTIAVETERSVAACSGRARRRQSSGG